MNRFNRKAKYEATKKSKSNSQSTLQKRREQLSESDSRSENQQQQEKFRKRVGPTKQRVPSPEKEKRTVKNVKKTVAQRPTPTVSKQKPKPPPSPPPVEEKKKSLQLFRCDSAEEQWIPEKRRDSFSHSFSGSQEAGAAERGANRNKPSMSNNNPIRSERSLIGLDGEIELEDEKKTTTTTTTTKKTSLTPPKSTEAAKGNYQSQEESSATETKDSISLADDEEQRDAYKKLFKEFAMSSQKLTLDDFKNEFAQLPGEPTREQCVAFNSLANFKKNRYTNIYCLDCSRVRLNFMTNKNVAGSEYIHANYIKSPFLKRDYILTQGPKKETIADFWRMVWQEKSTAIVMLCQFVEANREKCVEYFPRNANCTLRFEKLTLSYEESTVNKSMVTTRLRLVYEGESRLITHLQWKEWPDYQVPGSSEVMLKILRKVRARSTPPVIHCAAGVGRSGTLMAVEIALQAINSCFRLPDIKQIVTDLRTTGRASSVQTLQQYMLIWKVVLDFGVSNKLITEDSIGKFASTYRRSFRNTSTS